MSDNPRELSTVKNTKTRDEEIKESGEKFANIVNDIDPKDDLVWHQIRAAFIHGANWADQHSAYEKVCAERDALKQEVEILRLYGNKDCTAMADDRLAAIRRGEP